MNVQKNALAGEIDVTNVHYMVFPRIHAHSHIIEPHSARIYILYRELAHTDAQIQAVDIFNYMAMFVDSLSLGLKNDGDGDDDGSEYIRKAATLSSSLEFLVLILHFCVFHGVFNNNCVSIDL